MSAVEIRFFTETMPAPEYNCSEHTPEEWTKLYGSPRYILGIWSIIFATACQVLYVPSIRVFNRERRLTSYKIMCNLALADLGGISCVGTLFGYAMIRGYVFCSDTLLAWLIGYPVVCFWYVSSTNCIILVINRISELTDHAQAFKGWPSTLCLAVSIVYANLGMLFTRPVLFNSAIQTLAFDPLIPGHTMDEVFRLQYPNTLAIIHDVAVFFSVPTLYLFMCGIVRATSTQHHSTASTATQVMQAKIFTQATIICSANTGVAAAWTIQMFIVPSPIVIVGGTIFLQTVHGIPCIIYVILNNPVRMELWKTMGVKAQNVTHVSAFTSMNSQSAIAPSS